MPKHFETRVLPFTADQMFDLVADVSKYHEFLPWCDNAIILEQEDGVMLADLYISFKIWQARYTSRVLLDKKNYEINVELVQGPFKYLYNGWKFFQEETQVRLEFDIDFEMRSRILEKMVGFMFDEAFVRMVNAFENRAHSIYNKEYLY